VLGIAGEDAEVVAKQSHQVMTISQQITGRKEVLVASKEVTTETKVPILLHLVYHILVYVCAITVSSHLRSWMRHPS